ncbi:50S ribosomal protein L30e-like protein, partial [Protomyces lactucae-debilis]
KESAGDEADAYDIKAAHVIAIAQPLASKKLNKKVLKTVKKAAKQKHIKRGVKEVVKALRKKESSADKALVVIAGDISPIDVISHIPVLCEDHGIKYIYTPGKEELGAAGGTKRPTSVIMVQLGGKAKDGKEGDYKEAFEEILKELE